MIQRFHRLRRWAGVDRAVFFSNAAQMMRLVTGPITMALVLRHLTPEIQGYFYAFSGVVAMQIFLEMGFSQNILQFASHEFAKLRFTPAQTLEGDLVARSRLISLGRMAFGYYAVAAAIFFVAIGIGGHVYFTICSNKFSPDSFKDMASFAVRLEQPSDSASQFLHDHLSPPTRQALKDYQTDKSNQKTLQICLSQDLNKVIKGGSLYDALPVSSFNLRPETKQLQEQFPQGNALVRLNRLLLEDACPREIFRRHDVAWQWPWWMIAVTAALSLAVNPAWSLLEGCNQVAVIAKFRFWSALASFGANALALIAGAGIFASAIGAVFSLLISVGYLVVRWKPFLAQFLERPRHGRVSWAHEIWPFQWRIAVSWASGYFIFDIITPIAFYFCGAVEAGRLGMSLQLVRMISGVAMTWVYTKAPRFGMLIAARAWRELDSLWRRSMLQSFVFCLLGMGSFLAAISLIGHLSFLTAIPFIGQLLLKVPARLAPLGVNAWLAGAMLVQILTGAMAMELRAHKREPYMWLSVANAVLSVVFILPLVRVWGIYGEAIGYTLAIWAVFLPAYKVYAVKRMAYRKEADDLQVAVRAKTEMNPTPPGVFDFES